MDILSHCNYYVNEMILLKYITKRYNNNKSNLMKHRLKKNNINLFNYIEILPADSGIIRTRFYNKNTKIFFSLYKK